MVQVTHRVKNWAWERWNGRKPSSEREPMKLEHHPTPIEGIRSAPDLDSGVLCCGNATIQDQIDYRITLNHETFVIPNVWASVCSECDEVYFAPEVGDTILERIFEIQHPERANWNIY